MSCGGLTHGGVLMLILENVAFGLLFFTAGVTQNTHRYHRVYFILSTINAVTMAVKVICRYCRRLLRRDWNPQASLSFKLNWRKLIS
jgi:hypothetical protein